MRKTIFLLGLAVVALSLAACTKNQTGNLNEGAGNMTRQRPDFGQPERGADISGLVKSVTGNEVTIIKLDRPETARGTSTREQTDGTGPANGTRVITGQTGNIGLGAGGGPGGGRFMGGGPGGEGQDEESRAEMLARLKEMSSGEVTVLIPVGIKMLKPDSTTATGSERNQPSMLEASLIDISSDKMIRVWLDPSVTDRKIAEFVMIMR